MKKMHSHRQVIVNKPWGYEYLLYENAQVALWFLHIAHGQQTSMHCHPTKTTGLILLQGEAELSFLADKKKIKAPEKQMIRRGLFHSSKALSAAGIYMLEIETPKDKNDLVRLSDEYGRASNGYEDSKHEITKTDECVWIEEPELGEVYEYRIQNTNFTVERSNSISFLDNKKDDDILIFLQGGLGKRIDRRKHLATIPGDVGKASIVKRVAREMEFLEKNTLILTLSI